MKRLLFLFILAVSIAHGITAQDFDGYYTASLDINQPVANTNWVNTLSGPGVRLGYHRFLNEKFSLGGDINWGTYKQYQPTETIQNQSGAVTTDYFKYVYAYGIVLSGRYYIPTSRRLIKPYAGLGLGAAYNKYTLFYNTYTDQTKAWGFLARPEAGLLFRFNERRSIGATIGLHFDYSTAQAKSYGYNSFSNIGFTIGLIGIDW